MRHLVTILALFSAGLAGCSSYYLDQTWPDQAQTHLRVNTLLSDKKLDRAAFYRDSSGRVVIVMGGWGESVNVQAVETVAQSVGTIAGAIVRTAVLGVP